ncbi:hypothetical protein, partial [Actinacidiphila soli]|uniref:hypothetical protein n=1 Tax=Actinacidiphila soli TaxID=2487275 RepID=UPI0013E37554
PGRAGSSQPGLRRFALTVRRLAPAAAVLAALAGCAGHQAPSSNSTGNAASTIHNLGAVPIPSPPTAQATPTADAHRFQLVAIGDSVQANLPGTGAVIQASGPLYNVPTTGVRPPDHVTGTITIAVSQATTPLTIKAGDFTSRDEKGKIVSLAPTGAPAVTVTPGHRATLTLTGTFHQGAAQVTWRHNGKVMVIWDFTIELD